MTTINRPSTDDLSKSLSGKIILATGAASGIGLATAKLFYSSGAKVIIADLGDDRLKNAAAEVGPECKHYECNVTSWSEQVAMFQWVKDNIGSPDIVFCNAGIDPELKAIASDAQETKAADKVAYNYLADEYQDGSSILKGPSSAVMDVNYRGVEYGVKLAVHHMRKANGGRIIVTGSANSYFPIASSNMYDASKAAVLGLMRSTAARQDLPAAGITISMLCPSSTATPMIEIVPEEAKAHVKMSAPADVAWAVAYMATAPAQDVHGCAVQVKGTKLTEIEKSYQSWVTPLFYG
ncbi:hypothetical protein OHC33_004992 [Knufia fluminis]|uniref:Uncharacterized protein n=1 Tax=Knufia fluminis TaxID=191047 RepID=A0AAN8EKW4_9EURO|nr:hypothetical protein OHC33_004992 [Knufia fluminis]